MRSTQPSKLVVRGCGIVLSIRSASAHSPCVGVPLFGSVGWSKSDADQKQTRRGPAPDHGAARPTRPAYTPPADSTASSPPRSDRQRDETPLNRRFRVFAKLIHGTPFVLLASPSSETADGTFGPST